MGRMSELSIACQEQEQEDYMQELAYMHHTLCEAASICANDSTAFDFFLREMFRQKED